MFGVPVTNSPFVPSSSETTLRVYEHSTLQLKSPSSALIPPRFCRSAKDQSLRLEKIIRCLSFCLRALFSLHSNTTPTASTSRLPGHPVSNRSSTRAIPRRAVCRIMTSSRRPCPVSPNSPLTNPITQSSSTPREGVLSYTWMRPKREVTRYSRPMTSPAALKSAD